MASTKGVTYPRRPVPAQYDAGFFTTELQNIQRAIPSTVIRTSTTNATQQVDDRTVKMDATAGPLTFTLLSPQAAPTFPITVMKRDATGNTVTIVGTVNGQVNPVLAVQWTSFTMQADGSEWIIL